LLPQQVQHGFFRLPCACNPSTTDWLLYTSLKLLHGEALTIQVECMPSALAKYAMTWLASSALDMLSQHVVQHVMLSHHVVRRLCLALKG
jgi:hypothetical protein